MHRALGADDGHVVSQLAYWSCVVIGVLVCAAACVAARRRPGAWTVRARRILALLLLTVALTFVVAPIVAGTFAARSSLPVDLCDVAVVIAAIACWWPGLHLAVELTYFWGLAGTLQAVVTPDLSVNFPHLAFWEFEIGHLAIVFAAAFLVLGLGMRPRRGAVLRVFAITLGYAAFAGTVDAVTGGNYMFLRAVPAHASLLSVLGPWPWYIVGAAAIALALLTVLDLPFHRSRRAEAGRVAGRGPERADTMAG